VILRVIVPKDGGTSNILDTPKKKHAPEGISHRDRCRPSRKNIPKNRAGEESPIT
jgi:hypothetical protein